MILRTASRWLACLVLLAPIASNGQNLPELTLGQALDRTRAGNPALAATAAELQATQARATREALAPPLTLGAEVENFAGSGSTQGFGVAETTLRLGRTLELGGKRQARASLGDAEVAREQNRVEIERQAALGQTRLRFIEVLADQQRLRVAREHVELATRARDEVGSAVRSARIPATDLDAAELQLADADLELEHAEHELAAARIALASSWGSRELDFGEAVGTLDELPDSDTLENLAARFDDSPAHRDAALQSQVLAARRELARAASKPDLNATLGVRRLAGLDEQALVMSVSLPLGTRSRALLDRNEADALFESGEHRRSALRSDSYRLLFEKYQELLHARTEFESLRDRMLPTADRSLALARRGFDAGRFPYFTLAQAQERLIELRLRRIDAAARYLRLQAEIDLSGVPYSGDVP